MVLAIILLIITFLSSSAVYREVRSKNLMATLVTGSSMLIFGFLSISTFLSSL